eukprot:3519472-Rhodomonas_salina.2
MRTAHVTSTDKAPHTTQHTHIRTSTQCPPKREAQERRRRWRSEAGEGRRRGGPSGKVLGG